MPFFRRTHSSFYSGLRYGVTAPIKPGDPSPVFVNGDFEQDFKNWTIIDKRLSPGGVVAGVENTIIGCPIPAEPTPNPITINGSPSIGQLAVLGPWSSPAYKAEIVAGGPSGKYAKLSISGIWGDLDGPNGSGYTIFGPAIVSDNPVIAAEGDRVRFNWKAEAGGDAYNIFAYLIDPKQSCKHIVLLDDNGGAVPNTPWNTATRVIGPGEAGIYYFVFISGSFDYDRGGYSGGVLNVDEITLDKAGTF